MAKTKITALTELTDTNIANGDLIPIVDIDDFSQAASGTTKKVTITSLATAVASAFSGDSPTFVNLNTTGTTTLGDSGDATTVNGTLGVTGATTLSSTLGVTGATTLTGNVGIGAAPTVKLQIETSAGDGFKFSEGSDGGGYYGEFIVDGGGLKLGTTSGVRDVQFRVGSATKMIIDTAGNVGIGTAAPGYQLELSTNSAAKPTSSAWTISSDLRLKDNITLADLDKCLAIVKDIPLKRFTWKDDVYSVEQVSDRSKIGFIANDVQLVFPKAVKSNKFTKVKIEDGFELVEEDVFIETETEIEKKEIKLVNGKYKEVIIKEVKKNKEQVFDEFDLFDEAGEVIGKHKVAKKQTVSKPKFKQDVIEYCLSLDVDQINMALYGAVQLLIQKVEALEAK